VVSGLAVSKLFYDLLLGVELNNLPIKAGIPTPIKHGTALHTNTSKRFATISIGFLGSLNTAQCATNDNPMHTAIMRFNDQLSNSEINAITNDNNATIAEMRRGVKSSANKQFSYIVACLETDIRQTA